MAYKIKYTNEAMFTAAAAAHRINGGEYVKRGAMVLDPAAGEYQYKPHPKTPNAVIMEQVLSGAMETTPEDVQLGADVATHFRGLTFKLLAGKIVNEFERKALNIASAEQVNARDAAVVASLPSCWARDVKRKSVEDRLAECQSEYFGKIGQKVEFTGEVVQAVFSQQWGIWFVTVITDSNHAVFFSNKAGIKPGVKVAGTGKVKAFRQAGVTQLNYTKVSAV